MIKEMEQRLGEAMKKKWKPETDDLEGKIIQSILDSSIILEMRAKRKLRDALIDYGKECSKIFKNVSFEKIEEMDEEEYESKYGHKVEDLQHKMTLRHKLLDIEHEETMIKVTIHSEPLILSMDECGNIEINLDHKGSYIFEMVKTMILNQKMIEEDISLCNNCNCMTKTINRKCGKCKELKK